MIKQILMASAAMLISLCCPELYADSPCVEAYRQSHVDYAKSGDESLAELSYLYLLYFDFRGGFEQSTAESQRLLSAVGLPADQNDRVLSEFVRQMESGKLCGWFGPSSIEPAAKSIRGAIRP